MSKKKNLKVIGGLAAGPYKLSKLSISNRLHAPKNDDAEQVADWSFILTLTPEQIAETRFAAALLSFEPDEPVAPELQQATLPGVEAPPPELHPRPIAKVILGKAKGYEYKEAWAVKAGGETLNCQHGVEFKEAEAVQLGDDVLIYLKVSAKGLPSPEGVDGWLVGAEDLEAKSWWMEFVAGDFAVLEEAAEGEE